MEDEFLTTCDLCGDFFDIQQVRLVENGKNFYCDKCDEDKTKTTPESLG